MEKLSALLALCTGNSPVTGEFSARRTVTRSFDVFFDLHLNIWLSKQSWGWWSHYHCNGNKIAYNINVLIKLDWNCYTTEPLEHLVSTSWLGSKWRHDDVIKWEHFPRYWPFVRGIHRSTVNSPHKGQWHGALIFSLICALINSWVNNREAGDLRRQRAHSDVSVMNLGSFH